LEELGIKNYLVQPQDWEECGKGVKNDRLDAAALCQRLDRYERGNKKAFSTVRIPAVDEERERATSAVAVARCMDSEFFAANHGNSRILNRRVFAPSLLKAPKKSILSAFQLEEGFTMLVTDAHQKFLCDCQLGNLKSVQFKEFKQIARELILERYQLGFRHDLRTAEGRQTHG
jgi:hypothetical protein